MFKKKKNAVNDESSEKVVLENSENKEPNKEPTSTMTKENETVNEKINDENEEKKNVDQKKEKIKKHTFKRYFYGVGKEFERVSWTPKKTLFSNFIVVVVVVTFFALIFTGVTIGITLI